MALALAFLPFRTKHEGNRLLEPMGATQSAETPESLLIPVTRLSPANQLAATCSQNREMLIAARLKSTGERQSISITNALPSSLPPFLYPSSTLPLPFLYPSSTLPPSSSSSPRLPLALEAGGESIANEAVDKSMPCGNGDVFAKKSDRILSVVTAAAFNRPAASFQKQKHTHKKSTKNVSAAVNKSRQK